MRIRGLNQTLIFVLLLFIAMGDHILPSPFGDASRTIRQSANEFIVGLFPQGKAVKSPYGRNEEVLQHLE